MDQNDQLILIELEERVEQISSAIDALRSAIGDGKAERRLLEEIFRGVHTLKAAAQTHGLNDLTKLAHECEDVLHSIRIGRIQFDDRVFSVLDETSETFFELLTNPSVTSSGGKMLLPKLAQLSLPPNMRARAEVEIILSALPSEVWQSLNEEEKHKLQASVAEGASLFLISTNFDIVDFDRQFQNLKEKLSAAGELISTAPTVQQDRPDKIDFRILYTRQARIEAIRSDVAGFDGVTVVAVEGVSPTADYLTEEADSELRFVVQEHSKTQYIRVSVDNLNQIISSAYALAHQTEIVPDKNADVESGAAKLRQPALDLAAAIANLRMSPIDRLLQRVLRAGRTAARSCGKEVDFKIEGRDLLVDQSISDAIVDPLIHLVRNAVDHGIEPTDERLKNNKPPRGVITIKVSASPGQTRITVSDDGRGIVPKVIEEAAARLRLAQQALPLTLDQSVRMIFRSGFSTVSSVSETSGRGVGLDVVETEVERLGGQVRVSSQPGAGATFEIRLPVTFGLLEVVIVRLGKQRYLIDAKSAVAVEDIKYDEFGQFTAIKLSELLGQTTTEEDDRRSHALLLCEVHEVSGTVRRISLLLDEVEKREEVVVRDLGSHGARWFGIAGATELRSGPVALLLDLPRLIGEVGAG